ncbi:peptidoglycan-binding protein LysM [Flavobacterium restrictum]|uniref:Peptidoglycan-binding protein LysM n=1 Tax=Flavobacterium restrictum TaxID=2594428 RepID=A0A553DU02_9FLAO|nr:peptidoglycan-binding protein LysM [Flavobacterium restrictum]TRX36254.1 peptidoglycan-binding protein LysM [Flavobacterium restrictum]
MIKKWYFYSGLTVIIVFLSSGFKPLKLDSNSWFLVHESEGTHYLFPSEKQKEFSNLNIPFTGNFFIGYKEAIGFKESQGKYKKINSLGYLGKYQFGMETLKTVGVTNRSQFLNNPALQEKAFIALLSKNKWELKDVIDQYEGTIINGIVVTESGILAAAHLGGVGTVKKYFKNNGKRFFKDAYGTSIRSYMKVFGGYDTSFIIADSTARVL